MRCRLCLQSMICMPKDMRMRTVVVGCHVEEIELSICCIEKSSDKTGQVATSAPSNTNISFIMPSAR